MTLAAARFDIIVAPYPFTGQPASRRRPALVLSNAAWNTASGHVVCAMITSARQPAWPLDVPITDLASAGLTTACLVRMKLFTFGNSLVLRRAGALGAGDAAAVTGAIGNCF